MVNPILYTISTAFPNGQVASRKLHDQIAGDSGIATLFLGIRTDEDSDLCRVYFEMDPTPAEEAIVDGIVAAHDGVGTIVIFHASVKFVGGERAVAVAWGELGGSPANASFFVQNLLGAFGRFNGMVKAVGAGAQLRILEDDLAGSVVNLTPTPIPIPDTGGAYQLFRFKTSVPPRTGPMYYILEGRLGAATSAAVKHSLIALLEIRTL